MSFDELINDRYVDGYAIYVNGIQRNNEWYDANELYSTYLYEGDVVDVYIYDEASTSYLYDVYRRDYTNNDSLGDMGIFDTLVTTTPIVTGSTTNAFRFTIPSLPNDYNFEYRVSAIVVTPTPTPLPKSTTQTCPPPLMTSFSPLAGYTGTILQINGRNLSSVTGVTFSSTTTQVQPQLIVTKVPAKDITFLNNETIRLSVPQLGTGTLKVNTKLGVSGDGGTFILPTTFVYDPAINPATAASPGGYNNPTNVSPSSAATPTDNYNPQNTTAQVALTQTQKTQYPLGGDDILVVKVAPNIGVWTIYDQPKYSYTVSTFKTVNNKEVEEVEESKINDTLVNRVSQNVIWVTPDKQTFQVNRQNLITYEFDDIIKDDYPNQKLKFDIQFKLDAYQANPYSSQTKNFNYILIVPGPQTTSQGELQEPGSLVLVSDTSSGGLPNFSGEEYYNIKKPAGGYLTFKFSCPGLKTKNDPVVRVAGTSTKKTIRVEESSDTKYTNLITVDGIGSLVLSVSYTSSLYEINGRPLAASAQINFTL
jgi:hypothetical protein